MAEMNFYKAADIESIITFIRPVIKEKLSKSKNGISIDIRNQQRNRTTEQNKYLWAIYKHIVEFYTETGFIPDNLNVHFINSDFLHHYFKARFDIIRSSKLSTFEFCQYTDSIQHLMIEQSHGEYTPIYPPEELFETQANERAANPVKCKKITPPTF